MYAVVDIMKAEAAKAAIGQVWEVSRYWVALGITDEQTLYLTRRVGSTDTWEAFDMDSGEVVTVVLSSQLYERVV